jgi:hypothetical protein
MTEHEQAAALSASLAAITPPAAPQRDTVAQHVATFKVLHAQLNIGLTPDASLRVCGSPEQVARVIAKALHEFVESFEAAEQNGLDVVDADARDRDDAANLSAIFDAIADRVEAIEGLEGLEQDLASEQITLADLKARIERTDRFQIADRDALEADISETKREIARLRRAIAEARS